MILVVPVARQEEEVNGVILPSVGNADLAEGKVLAVSPYLDVIYKVGDTVLYYAKRGVGCLVGGKPHILLNGGNGLEQGDILAIINE
jgi:co-chaperonin GroES (HSP10)